MMVATVEESTPPLSMTPMGTSATICRLTAVLDGLAEPLDDDGLRFLEQLSRCGRARIA